MELHGLRTLTPYLKLGARAFDRGLFQWADDAFPVCEHSQRSTLRRVLKPGPSNGRYFYACSQGKAASCQFFCWADLHPGAVGREAKRRRAVFPPGVSVPL